MLRQMKCEKNAKKKDSLYQKIQLLMKDNSYSSNQEVNII